MAVGAASSVAVPDSMTLWERKVLAFKNLRVQRSGASVALRTAKTSVALP